jgi:alcohol dehydrogenase class IV
MKIKPFTFSANPKLIFGPGKIKELPDIIGEVGSTILLVTGGSSFRDSGRLEELLESLEEKDITVFEYRVEGEPYPELVDYAVQEFQKKSVHCVAAVGGGSVIDAGKAISAMLPQKESVMEYLEGIGKKKHDGVKAPFIAVPTTAGTGSEATKNAVLSRVGKDGFKKSLRHDNFIADAALLDPELLVSCPPGVSAASGMDAFAQLLEAYMSTKASPLTDALALSGLEHIKEGLIPSCTTAPDDLNARGSMAYAAYLSGITLSNAGLGVTHGIGGIIGGHYEIPHGVISAVLTGPATEANIRALEKAGTPEADAALYKYAFAGYLLSGEPGTEKARGCGLLIDLIKEWTRVLGFPRLSEMGVPASDIQRLAEESDNKNNPVNLSQDEIKSILEKAV